jgi:uncharacterized damage-inducible protein DinB
MASFGAHHGSDPDIAGAAGRNGEGTMPGLVPPVVDERDALLSFLAQQRDALRYAAHGLPDEQASATPTVSELSLAGLIKHVALVEHAWITFLKDGDSSVFMPDYDWADGFRLVGSETLADVLAFSADVATRTEKIVADLDDLGALLPATTQGVPWIPAGLVWTPRWVLLHIIEETARHAGHADILRESIDGQTCYALMAAAEGWTDLPWE